MRKILKRHWNIMVFTTIYLIFISDKETPNKYIYIIALSIFIPLIDMFIEKIRKKKNEKF